VSVPTLVFGAREEELRASVRAWLHDNDPGSLPSNYDAQVQALRQWQAALHRAGWIGLSLPSQYGGRGLHIGAEAVLAEELAHAGMPELINRVALYTVAPTLLDFGTPAQCAAWIPGMLDASEIWCQGFSEPDAGSDLASVRTAARRDGEHLVVSGQKVWTSRSTVAAWCAALVRTDAGSERHHGLSLLAVDMAAPGITVRPLLQAMHEPHFAEVFFDDVRVPVANVIGEVGGGWRASMAMLGYERGLFVLERQMRLRRRLEQLADAILARGAASDALLEKVGDVYASLELLRAQVYRTLAAQAAGSLQPGETSVDKLMLADVDQRLFALAVDVLDPADALRDNAWTHDLLGSRAVSIYSGTSQIQRNIIASQLLRLRGARA
jgi:alkylation response protein AidB-like acyl-CoA dehydrogenase